MISAHHEQNLEELGETCSLEFHQLQQRMFTCNCNNVNACVPAGWLPQLCTVSKLVDRSIELFNARPHMADSVEGQSLCVSEAPRDHRVRFAGME